MKPTAVVTFAISILTELVSAISAPNRTAVRAMVTRVGFIVSFLIILRYPLLGTALVYVTLMDC